MIRITQLKKRFGRLQVLQGINLSLERGRCIALIGPNGCGKTTLIKTILGMVLPEEGKVEVLGENILNQHEYRKQIGYMPQIGRYPDNMTIGQILEMIINLRGHYEALDEDLLRAYISKDMYSKRMNTLSGGTTQKVSAVLAFLFNPLILILDEPTAGLDPVSAEVLKDKIELEKAKGKLIIITSHMLSELDGLVTDVIFMQEGLVKLFEPVEEMEAITGERRLSAAISKLLKQKKHEQNC